VIYVIFQWQKQVGHNFCIAVSPCFTVANSSARDVLLLLHMQRRQAQPIWPYSHSIRFTPIRYVSVPAPEISKPDQSLTLIGVNGRHAGAPDALCAFSYFWLDRCTGVLLPALPPSPAPHFSSSFDRGVRLLRLSESRLYFLRLSATHAVTLSPLELHASPGLHLIRSYTPYASVQSLPLANLSIRVDEPLEESTASVRQVRRVGRRRIHMVSQVSDRLGNWHCVQGQNTFCGKHLCAWPAHPPAKQVGDATCFVLGNNI
jgi:hypothetical protein